MGYHFTAQWVEGAVNGIADALSHYPISDPAPQEHSFQGRTKPMLENAGGGGLLIMPVV